MEILDPIPIEFWQGVVEKCPWATFFHTPRWAALIENTFPEYRIESTGFVLDSGAHAVIPCVYREKRGFFKKRKEYKSMEPGVYGGIVADKHITAHEADPAIRYLISSKHSAGRMVESPFKRIALSLPLKTKELTTHIVELSPEFDEVGKKFNRGQKSNLKQARKKNVTVRRAETEDDIEQYDHMYRETLERWGQGASRTYPLELFQNLLRMKDPGACFWLAEVDSIIIAGIIVLSWGRNLVYWHGCALRDYFKYYPNNILHETVMKWACENGFTHYDMGASMDLEGVRKFKESFGARPVEYKAYRWK